jgi:epsilon-lactone hydrolase
MVTLTNVIIWWCTPAMLNDERGSLRSRGAAAVSSLTVRQISAVLPPEQAWGLWLSRQIVARVMDTFGPSRTGTHVVPVDTRTSDGRRVVGEWVYGAGVPRDRADTAIYFVHGSGYVLCSPRTHRRLTSGDSAGGHLSVDLLLQPDVVHPSALVLLSPVVDLTFALARTRERVRPDPAIRSRDAVRLLELYCAGVDSSHPRLKLDVAAGRALPPTLIQAGGRCELQIWPDQVHVFQALPGLSPEARPAMGYITTFIADALRDTCIDQAAG